MLVEQVRKIDFVSRTLVLKLLLYTKSEDFSANGGKSVQERR